MSFLNCCLESKIYTRKLLAGGSEIARRQKIELSKFGYVYIYKCVQPRISIAVAPTRYNFYNGAKRTKRNVRAAYANRSPLAKFVVND